MDRLQTKRSIAVGSRKTSVSLEDGFWEGLRDIAKSRQTTLSSLVEAIKAEHPRNNLSSAIRLFVLEHYRGQQILK